MTPTTYHKRRKRIGTVPEAARALGVSIRTIQLREAGKAPIHREAELAIRALTEQKHKPTPPQGRYYWER